ncbi:hypothetical protein Sm713_60220 [Streptomyces sp. TS71-3]|nr:hypothetical protein Sm713_60220 [Streptomyces sp. TS71-3]
MSLMFCVRCDRPIRQGEPYDTHVHHGATGAGTTNYSHKRCPAPDQSGSAPCARRQAAATMDP